RWGRALIRWCQAWGDLIVGVPLVAKLTYCALDFWPGWVTCGLLGAVGFVAAVVGWWAADEVVVPWTEGRIREAIEAELPPRLGVWGPDGRKLRALVLSPRRERGVQAVANVSGTVTRVDLAAKRARVEGRWSVRWPVGSLEGLSGGEEGQFAYELRFNTWTGRPIVWRSGRILWSSLFFEGLADLVPIEGDSFLMGSLDGEESAYLDERPQHRQTVAAFAMASAPVTNAVWRAVMGRDKPGAAAHPVVSVNWFQTIEFLNKWSQLAGRSPAYSIDGQGARSPVPYVSRRSKSDGFRLPTEIEWEYAARGGTTTLWSFGSEHAHLAKYAWCIENCSSLKSVRSRPPNPFGLFDVHGLVWEWCWDYYRPYPHDGPVPPNLPWGDFRIVRGGSFEDPAMDLRSANRMRFKPDFSDNVIGIRCASRSRRDLNSA
ncbi:MAG: formylglycine-generating enzyme family protein, partial [Myxococcota bacterium]